MEKEMTEQDLKNENKILREKVIKLENELLLSKLDLDAVIYIVEPQVEEHA